MTERQESRPHNSTYPKVAVQWLNQALCLYQRFVHLMKFSAENPRLRKAAKRQAVKKTSFL